MTTTTKNRKRCKYRSDKGKKCRANAQRGEDWCWVHHPDGRAKDANGDLCARMSPGGHQCRNAPITGERWCRSHHPDAPITKKDRKTKKPKKPTAPTGPCRCSQCFTMFSRGPSHTASMVKPEAMLAHKQIALDQAPYYCDRCCVTLFPTVFTWPSLGATG
jgi:hypothetical protein